MTAAPAGIEGATPTGPCPKRQDAASGCDPAEPPRRPRGEARRVRAITGARMSATKLSRRTLDDLKRRHVAFLEARLSSDQAREDWTRACIDGYEQLLTLRIRDAVDPATIADALLAALTADSIRSFFAPVARDLHRRVLASLKTNRKSLGDYVPADARLEIEALLARSDLVPDALVRKIFEEKVIVDAIDDTLYEGLLQFNTTVNPFFADWGLPAILRRMPIGGAMILASMEAMRAEFDRRLEPEIRKFLAAFSRRSSDQLTQMFLASSGDPKLVELRRNLVGFLYSQSIAELLAGVDVEMVSLGARALEHVVVEVLDRELSSRNLRDALERFVGDHGDATVGDWLREIGASGRPDLERWADLAWPQVRGVVRSPLVRDYLERITAEFYDGLPD